MLLRSSEVVVVCRLDRRAAVCNICGDRRGPENAGIGLISLTKSIDTTWPDGGLSFSVFGALAEYERSMIQERVRAGIAAAKARGVRMGRRQR
jgi:DNA invertase Pin-like site-specific DNA recombinase